MYDSESPVSLEASLGKVAATRVYLGRGQRVWASFLRSMSAIWHLTGCGSRALWRFLCSWTGLSAHWSWWIAPRRRFLGAHEKAHREFLLLAFAQTSRSLSTAMTCGKIAWTRTRARCLCVIGHGMCLWRATAWHWVDAGSRKSQWTRYSGALESGCLARGRLVAAQKVAFDQRTEYCFKTFEAVAWDSRSTPFSS